MGIRLDWNHSAFYSFYAPYLLVCSSGCFGNVKGFAHLSCWPFLYRNVSFSLNNIPVRILCCICLQYENYLIILRDNMVQIIDRSFRKCFYAAPTQSSNCQLINISFQMFFFFVKTTEVLTQQKSYCLLG